MPLLEVAPGRYLAESNAILWYVAGGTPLAPEDRIDRAEALQWMFFEQHSLEPNLGAAYFWLTLVKGGRELQRHALEDWMEKGYRALGVMEKHLASTTSSPPTATPSPTSRSTPTRTSRTSATSTSHASRRCAPGSSASPTSPATSPWTGSRRRSQWRNDAALRFH